jgi:peptidoglycan/LPS O-acetylase OafA/YrhL
VQGEAGSDRQAAPGRLASLLFDKRSSARLQFDALDGLRGVAVLFVMLSHLGNNGAFVGLDFAGSGKYGVYLFFVLSAFLLTLPLLGLPPGGFARPRRWAGYAVRRVLRIFPLYATVLVVNHALWARWEWAYVIPMPREDLVSHLLLRQGTHLYWTIPVEFTYYLVLPFVAFALATALRAGLPVALLAGGAALAVLAALSGRWERAIAAGDVALLPYLATFLCGSLAACAHHALVRRGGLRGRAARGAAELAGWLAVAGVLALVPDAWSRLTGQAVPRDAFQTRVLLFGALWAVALLGGLHGWGGLRRVLELAPLRAIGIVSFSLYLLHLPLVWGATRGLGLRGAAALGAALASATALAALSYLAIERPFLRSRWALSLARTPVPERGEGARRAVEERA